MSYFVRTIRRDTMTRYYKRDTGGGGGGISQSTEMSTNEVTSDAARHKVPDTKLRAVVEEEGNRVRS